MCTACRKPTRPVTGSCRWILSDTAERLALGLPAGLTITTATGTALYFVTRHETGYRVEKDGGDTHDLDLDLTTCTCADCTYRQRACRHLKALKAALAAL